MKAVLMRVKRASVTIDEKETRSIGEGYLILLGVTHEDTEVQAVKLADKLCSLRIFEDEEGKMNRSVMDVKGDILAVSQFTLLGDVRKGKRPSFTKAAAPESANDLYRKVIGMIEEKGVHVEEGIFQAEMMVEIHNDGPVTILLDSNKLF
jgi:D-tyrosyl-tRNA(Tyr) deacylase